MANIIERDINDVLTAASITDNSKKYSVKTKFDDIKILANVIQKLGFRYNIISAPDTKEKVQEDYDVTKR